MGDHQRRQRELGQHVLQLAAHRGASVRVERRQRLVEQQHVGIAGQRARQRDPLALAARQPPGALAGQVGDAQALEELVDALLAAEGHVGADRHVREQRVLLEHEPDGAPLGREVDLRLRVEPDPLAERDAPAIGPAQPGDRAQDGGLPRPRWPDQRHRLRADAQAETELERAKVGGDVELERLHVERILYESSTPPLSTTSSTPIDSATSKSDSSCS